MLIRAVSASQAVMYPSVFIPMLLKLNAVVETTKEGPLNPMPTPIPVIVDRRTKAASAAEIKSDWVASTASSGSSAAAYIAEEHRGRMPQRTTSLNSFIYYPNARGQLPSVARLAGPICSDSWSIDILRNRLEILEPRSDFVGVVNLRTRLDLACDHREKRNDFRHEDIIKFDAVPGQFTFWRE